MSKYVYPAVFTPAAEGGYVVTFPDWKGATQGDDIADALNAAKDFVGLACQSAEHDNEPLPESTPRDKVEVPEGGFVNLMMADIAAYQEVIDRENNPIKYARKRRG